MVKAWKTSKDLRLIYVARGSFEYIFSDKFGKNKTFIKPSLRIGFLSQSSIYVLRF